MHVNNPIYFNEHLPMVNFKHTIKCSAKIRASEYKLVCLFANIFEDGLKRAFYNYCSQNDI